MDRIQLNLKFSFECQAKELFAALTRPTLLQNWMAERVEFDETSQIYKFWWGDSTESAKVIERVSNQLFKLGWIGRGDREDEQLSFRIDVLPEDDFIDLYVTDYCDENERKSITDEWQEQMNDLESLLR